MTSILKLKGVNDQNEVTLTPASSGLPLMKISGCVNILDRCGIDQKLIQQLVMFGDKVRQPAYPVPKDTVLVFNEISDPDSHRIALKRAMHLCQRANIPVINSPDAIEQTTRDNVSTLLQDIPDVIMPRTVRFQPRSPRDVFGFAAESGFEFPFIIRVAGTHRGKSMNLIRGNKDKSLLNAYAFNGDDYYLTEFNDYRNDLGIYHKQQIIFIDGEPLARDHVFENHWNVHVSSRVFMTANPEHGEEVELVRQLENKTLPRVRPALLEIARRIKLDYFGLDCHIFPDGKVLVFEANANMDFLYCPIPALQPWLDQIRIHLRKMLSDRSGMDFARKI
jgi:hypothetical protein